MQRIRQDVKRAFRAVRHVRVDERKLNYAFDSYAEVNAALPSSAILRIPYQMLPRLSARDDAKLYRLDGGFVLALKEPYTRLLFNYREVYIVLTHNLKVLSRFEMRS